MPTRNRDLGWVNDVAFDAFCEAGPLNPEPAQSGLLDHDNWDNLAGPAADISLRIREPCKQARHATGLHLVPRHLGSYGSRKGGQQPHRAKEFQGNED